MTIHLSIDQPATLYAPERAANMVAELNSDEYDDWDYTIEVIEANHKYVRIAITDEDGEFVAHFSG